MRQELQQVVRVPSVALERRDELGRRRAGALSSASIVAVKTIAQGAQLRFEAALLSFSDFLRYAAAAWLAASSLPALFHHWPSE